MSQDDSATLEHCAARLEASGDYRVLRRLTPRRAFCRDEDGDRRIGIIVDVETTGLDEAADEIIELGMVKFDYAPDGRVFQVLDDFEGLRQPRRPIPREITELTGITDQMVAGHSIDPAEVDRFIGGVDLIIAHNAAFDRKFCERLAAGFTALPWACSLSEIRWSAEGFDGAKLGYLLAGNGLFHDGHRAAGDCLALLEILSRRLPKSGEAALKRLLDSSARDTVRILAVNSPFEARDILKKRGYRWNPGDSRQQKCWWRDIPEDQAEAELAYLRKEICKQSATIPTTRVSARDRYSIRA